MMIRTLSIRQILTVAALTSATLFSCSAFAFDAAAADVTLRREGCFKCHAVDRKKDGPTYREVAAKYKGKPEAEKRLLTHITTGEKAKFADGHEEDHKIIKTKDVNEIKNAIQWILSL